MNFGGRRTTLEDVKNMDPKKVQFLKEAAFRSTQKNNHNTTTQETKSSPEETKGTPKRGRPAKDGNLTWFRVDTGFHNSSDALVLQDDCGMEGFGIFICILSIIAKSPDGYIEASSERQSKILARQVGCRTKKLNEVLRSCQDIGLLDVSDGKMTSYVLFESLEKTRETRRRAKEYKK